MKYFSLWELDMSRMPVDAKERNEIMMNLIKVTRQWKKDHPDGDWGSFIGENKGFSMGGNPQDIMKLNMIFAPYVHFKVYQAASIEEVEEMRTSLMQMQPK